MLKHEIPINKLCPQSVLKHSVVHFQGVAMKFENIFQNIFDKGILFIQL
jgi:hypothetical protein